MLPVAVTVDVQLVLCLDGEVMSVELAKSIATLEIRFRDDLTLMT